MNTGVEKRQTKHSLLSNTPYLLQKRYHHSNTRTLNLASMDKMMGLDIADKHNCVLVYEPTYLYRKSPTRSRAAYV